MQFDRSFQLRAENGYGLIDPALKLCRPKLPLERLIVAQQTLTRIAFASVLRAAWILTNVPQP
jgi:hypothetical protein